MTRWLTSVLVWIALASAAVAQCPTVPTQCGPVTYNRLTLGTAIDLGPLALPPMDPVPGTTYYNTTLGAPQFYNGNTDTWVTVGSGGGSGTLINVSASYTTVAGNATICVADTASPPTITLGAGLPANTVQTITDCGGDAGTQNITIAPTTGTISGFTNVVFNQNGTSQAFLYTGTAWVMQ
jgi:hypothetical protein